MFHNSSDNSTSENHQCRTRRQDDWLIYECPDCDFELWDNLETGETKILNAQKDVNHSGSFFPPAYRKALENPN